jgi:hypothetical protein
VTQYRPTRPTHTPITPGRRRPPRRRSFAFGVVCGVLIWVSVVVIVWAAREILG